jgi:hypothetical protein
MESNQYALYSAESTASDYVYLKVENDSFFSADERYKEDIEFQSENEDWYPAGQFKVRNIAEELDL